MMAKLPWVLLAISVIFNFTFAGAFLHARSDLETADSPEAPAKMVADELGLSEDQKKAFAEIRAEAKTKADQLRESIVLARQELWSQIAGGSGDSEQISELNGRLAELYRQYRMLPGEHARRFLGTLDPAQREAAIERIRRHERHKYGYRRLLEQFDTNGDGRLDKEERARASEAFRSRRGGGRHPSRPGGPHYPRPGGTHRPGPGGGMYRSRQRGPTGGRPTTGPQPNGGQIRTWLLEEFDTDGDGKLSDKERSAAQEAIRARLHRGPSQPPRPREPIKHHPRKRG